MRNFEKTMRAIEYVEENLYEKLNLHNIAGAINSSPYHLHRIFSTTTGLTIHNYLRRRQLTEAARMLYSSDESILGIAFSAGYESQQAFNRIFKVMYKCSPDIFRKNRMFYPLQLRFDFKENYSCSVRLNPSWNIVYAQKDDIPAWMNLVKHVIDGYPYFDEEQYLNVVKGYILRKQAWIAKDGNTIAGNILLSYDTGRIDFIGVHPLYRRTNLHAALLNKAICELRNQEKEVSITTYREGDKADTGYRSAIQLFGFTEAELLIEFGYPTQKFIYTNNVKAGNPDE